MSKRKYFVSYVAYSKNSNDKDFFNNIVTFTEDEQIDLPTIQKMQSDLLEIFENDEESKGVYIATQIIGLTPIENFTTKDIVLKENDDTYGISIYDKKNEVYEFTCKNKSFANEFSELLHSFFNKYEGAIKKY